MVHFIRSSLPKSNLFFGLRNRTTEVPKPEKARNIKENRHSDYFSTASKQQDVHLSSPRDNLFSFFYTSWDVGLRKYRLFGQSCTEQNRLLQLKNKNNRKQEIVPKGAYLLLFLSYKKNILCLAENTSLLLSFFEKCCFFVINMISLL